MSLHADEGNGFPLTRLHHFPAVLRATNLQLPVAVILSSTIYTKLDAITLPTYPRSNPTRTRYFVSKALSSTPDRSQLTEYFRFQNPRESTLC